MAARYFGDALSAPKIPLAGDFFNTLISILLKLDFRSSGFELFLCLFGGCLVDAC